MISAWCPSSVKYFKRTDFFAVWTESLARKEWPKKQEQEGESDDVGKALLSVNFGFGRKPFTSPSQKSSLRMQSWTQRKRNRFGERGGDEKEKEERVRETNILQKWLLLNFCKSTYDFVMLSLIFNSLNINSTIFCYILLKKTLYRVSNIFSSLILLLKILTFCMPIFTRWD